MVFMYIAIVVCKGVLMPFGLAMPAASLASEFIWRFKNICTTKLENAKRTLESKMTLKQNWRMPNAF